MVACTARLPAGVACFGGCLSWHDPGCAEADVSATTARWPASSAACPGAAVQAMLMAAPVGCLEGPLTMAIFDFAGLQACACTPQDQYH